MTAVKLSVLPSVQKNIVLYLKSTLCLRHPLHYVFTNLVSNLCTSLLNKYFYYAVTKNYHYHPYTNHPHCNLIINNSQILSYEIRELVCLLNCNLYWQCNVKINVNRILLSGIKQQFMSVSA